MVGLWPRFILVSSFLLFGLLQDTARAQNQEIKLQADYADFELDPDTGNLVALNAEKGEVVLIEFESFKNGRSSPSKKLKVGQTPCSVFYKRFGDKRIFAVVCSEDMHMFLIDAETFTQLAKVPLTAIAVSSVTGSRNPEDPFVYYCYGAGHESAAGVVNLRDYRDQGRVLHSTMDCAVSAEGKYVYQRGPYSPSGFNSLLRVNGFEEAKPIFQAAFSKHESVGAYLPDPFELITAAGSDVHSVMLDRQIGTLRIVPLAFAAKLPVIFGVERERERENNPAANTATKPSPTVTLAAASYNTLQMIGEKVVLERPIPVDAGDLPRGIAGQSDSKRVGKKTRLLVDDLHKMIFYAEREFLAVVPIKEFQLPDEPILIAKYEGIDSVTAMRESTISVTPMDDRVKLKFDDLPGGAIVDGAKIKWTPTADQVGQVTMTVGMTHGDSERTELVPIDVSYPNVRLPFSPQQMLPTEDGKQVLIWEASNNAMRPGAYAGQSGEGKNRLYRLALVDTATGKVLAEKKVGESPVACELNEQSVFIRYGEFPKCDIFKRSNFEKEKSLLTATPVTELVVIDDLLILRTQATMEVFNAKTFERLRVFGGAYPRQMSIPQSPILRHGLVCGGTLFGFDLKPKFVWDVPGLPYLVDNMDRSVTLPAIMNDRHEKVRVEESRNGGMRGMEYSISNPSGAETVVASRPVPGTDVTVSLKVRFSQEKISRSEFGSQIRQRTTVSATGGAEGGQLLVNQIVVNNQTQTPPEPPLLRLANGKAMVVQGDHLYVWAIPKSENADLVKPIELDFLPKQSHVALEGTGTTKLKHEVVGGALPLEYTLLRSTDGISIDSATGVITIDEKPVLEQAKRNLITSVMRQNRGELYVDTLRNVSSQMIESATFILQRKPRGVPIVVPISLQVSDQDSVSRKFQYCIIAEVSSPEVMAELKAMDDKRTKARIEQEQTVQQMAQRAEADRRGTGDLNRRVQSLEERLDLVTRQLNEVLKKLEKEEK